MSDAEEHRWSVCTLETEGASRTPAAPWTVPCASISGSPRIRAGARRRYPQRRRRLDSSEDTCFLVPLLLHSAYGLQALTPRVGLLSSVNPVSHTQCYADPSVGRFLLKQLQSVNYQRLFPSVLCIFTQAGLMNNANLYLTQKSVVCWLSLLRSPKTAGVVPVRVQSQNQEYPVFASSNPTLNPRVGG